MNIKTLLKPYKLAIDKKIQLGGSKSISNRYLILDALYPDNIEMENLSDSEDTVLLQKALHQIKHEDIQLLDIHHAGTAMRFLTAFLSIKNGASFTLTGSERMKQRPIKVLVDALNGLGADIQYVENEGFPPLKIHGKTLHNNSLHIDAGISSQYLTALTLIGSTLPYGMISIPNGTITSLPYLNMTLSIQHQLGIASKLEDGKVIIPYTPSINQQCVAIESDWSSCSHYYSIAALASKAYIEIGTFYKNSLQGDARIAEIYQKYFGVNTFYKNGKILLTSEDVKPKFEEISLDLSDCPDIAQTIAVTACGKKIPIHLTGLHTLKIKETDRIVALKNEMEKFGALVEITDASLSITGYQSSSNLPIRIQTYNDHRMAMAFAPLCAFYPLEIEHPEVVQKSYPNFWKDFESMI